MKIDVDYGKSDLKATEVAIVVAGQPVDSSFISYKDNSVIIDKQAFAHLPNGRYNASIVFNNSIYTTINDKLTIDVYNSQVGLDDEPPVTANA